MKNIRYLFFIVLMVVCNDVKLSAQQPNPPGQVKNSEQAKNKAYLFAHMLHSDYGRLYYAVSLDGLHWNQLNGTARVFESYHGHPDICKGHDGRYYLVGNNSDADPQIHFWVSDDLIDWQPYSLYSPDLKNIPDYANPLQRIGAPKLYYDQEQNNIYSLGTLLIWMEPKKIRNATGPASVRCMYYRKI